MQGYAGSCDVLCVANVSSCFYIFLIYNEIVFYIFFWFTPSHLISKIKDIQRLSKTMGNIFKELHCIHGVCYILETTALFTLLHFRKTLLNGWAVGFCLRITVPRGHTEQAWAGKWQHMTMRKGCLHCGSMLVPWIWDIFWSHHDISWQPQTASHK